MKLPGPAGGAKRLRVLLFVFTVAATSCSDPDQMEGNGTIQNPFVIAVDPSGLTYSDSRDTSKSPSNVLDAYPTLSRDLSGPEYVYRFSVSAKMDLTASVDCGPGVDVDIQLLSSVEPPGLIEADNLTLSRTLDPGTYYLTVDTFVSVGIPLMGPYSLTVVLAPSP